MDKDITHVGLDAHQEAIQAATLLPGGGKCAEDRFANTPESLRRWARRLLQSAPGTVMCCYEAGPLGYGLKRVLEALGVRCVVVAPALIPVKPGDRIKTDRCDARKLAELLRAGPLTEVHAPTPEQEAARDLSRAREAVKRDQMRIRICGLRSPEEATRMAAERGHGLEERATVLCDRRAMLSEPAILNGAYLPTEHGHAALPPGQPAHIRLTPLSRSRPLSAGPSRQAKE